MNFSRPLHDNNLVQTFLQQVLQFDHEKYPRLISRIVESEFGVEYSNEKYQTATHTEYRSRKFKEDVSRWKIRKQIINELLTLKRLENDDQIRLGKGGALPNGHVKAERQAILVIGLPASGKSTISAKIADNYGALIIDSDFAKRKLPEYRDSSFGPNVVHDESSEITKGFKKIENPDRVKSLYEVCIEKDYNIVIPTIGNSANSILALANALKTNNGYKVHLILISLLKREATIRAAIRFHETGRYVPLGLVFDGFGNDPCLSYYFLRAKHTEAFKSLGVISTNVPFGSPPLCTDSIGETPASSFAYNEEVLM